MKYLKIKDQVNRVKYFNTEIKNKIRKFLFVNLLSSSNLNKTKKKIITKFFFSKKKSNSFRTKVLRRCLLTNRNKVSSRYTGISRVKLRDLLKENEIPGFNKKIW